MAERMPANTIKLGSNAYLIESPNPDIGDCLVMAHGASVDRTRKFTVPAGVTVRFFVDAGDKNTAHGGILPFIAQHIQDRGNGVVADEGAGRRTYVAEQPCPDYILSKALGRHFRDAGGQASYLQVRNALHGVQYPGNGANWIPHVVTVRNRTSPFLNQNIWLSTLIAAIRRAKPGVENIYCANCRSVAEDRANALTKTAGGTALHSKTGR